MYDKQVDDEDEKGLLYVDCGESLSIFKSLLLAKREIGEDWLRNVFHTTSTVAGKVCS